ncbi:MAG: hypothetical protein QM702_09615 [Rubrivivax sp.]
MKLFWRECQRMDRERSASLLLDVNSAMVGGDAANRRLKMLNAGS